MMRAGFIAPAFQLRKFRDCALWAFCESAVCAFCECTAWGKSPDGAGDAGASISEFGSDNSGFLSSPGNVASGVGLARDTREREPLPPAIIPLHDTHKIAAAD
jgi:hypothetical protein